MAKVIDSHHLMYKCQAVPRKKWTIDTGAAGMGREVA